MKFKDLKSGQVFSCEFGEFLKLANTDESNVVDCQTWTISTLRMSGEQEVKLLGRMSFTEESQNLTYRRLGKLIEELPEEHKDDNVTIHLMDTDEYLPVSGWGVAAEGHDLDFGHLILEVDF